MPPKTPLTPEQKLALLKTLRHNMLTISKRLDYEATKKAGKSGRCDPLRPAQDWKRWFKEVLKYEVNYE